MRWPAGLQFLEHARAAPLYLVDDGIFSPVCSDGKMIMRRRGSLSAQAKALAARAQVQASGIPSPSQRAREYLSALDEFDFVLRELLPYLRFLATEDASQLGCPQELDEALRQLSHQAADVQGLLGPPPKLAIEPGLLRRFFPVPCAVLGEIVVPMARAHVGLLGKGPADVQIGGAHYRLCMQRFRPLQQILAEVGQALAALVQERGPGDERRDEAAIAFCRQLDQSLSVPGPRSAGPGHFVYHDRYHRLHYRRGRFVLVRGPVPSPGAKGMIYVGLAIKGKNRQQRLSVCPAVAHSPQQFWTPLGTPVVGGMCMGSRSQYQRLLSDQFTDSEATVHWLDAGVRIATGASALHRRLLRPPRAPVRRGTSTKEVGPRVGTRNVQAILRSSGIGEVLPGRRRVSGPLP